MERIGAALAAVRARAREALKVVLIAVGKVKAPFAEADAHYRKLLQRHQPVEVIEVRDEVNLEGRVPSAPTSSRWTAAAGRSARGRGASWLAERRIDALDLCFLIGGPRGLRPGRPRPRRRADLARAPRRWLTSSLGSCSWSSSSGRPRSSPASRTTTETA